MNFIEIKMMKIMKIHNNYEIAESGKDQGIIA